MSILACAGDSEDPAQPGSSFQQCGTIAGLTCDDPNEICVQDDAMCGVSDASGTCQEVPQFCAQVYDPVCGCDGKTYGNSCEAGAAGASVDYTGECVEANDQVCGTRGAAACGAGEFCIYEESANCGRTDLPGTCQTPSQFCPAVVLPVCGCDGKTYNNECEAHGAGVSVDYEGPCQDTSNACGGFAGVVCPTGEFCNYTETAQCGFADATGTCETQPQFCAQVFDPVCGCDGNDYSNECMANVQGVAVLHKGSCSSSN